ncbi:MAG: hypothetical protein ACI9VT_003466 [Psychroserpens sp.]|jgi:hypothetical protein
MAECFSAIPDSRQQNKYEYNQPNILMSTFACMYFQDPSLLHFQKRLEQDQQRNNLRNILNVQSIPSNNQLRDVLDEIFSEALAPIFKNFYEKLRRHKHLEGYAILPNVLCVQLMVHSIIAPQYHSSNAVSCSCCLPKEHKSGEITYSHNILQGAIMHPDKETANSCDARSD